MMLSEIAHAVGGKINIEAEVTDISTDTRNITDGCLFIAIKGENFDGHTFVAKALENGAVSAVTEKPIDGCPCIVVESTRKALLDIACYYRKKFSPILVGVTGSVGKTTTKEMIALVLSEKYNTLKTEGNHNNEIGLPKTLFGLDSTHEAAVIEMGMSALGEIERLSKTAIPNIAVITNIGFSHIEHLKSQEGILQAKLEILIGAEENAPLVVNADDKYLYPLKERFSGLRTVYTYGIDNENSDFRAINISECDGSTTFTVSYADNKTADITLPCIGRHNVMNALAAFCIGTHCGMNYNEITSALKKYKADSLRQNVVKMGEQTVIIDCYNASPDSMRASLSVLSHMSGGRKIAVLGDMLELGEMSHQLHEMVGEMVIAEKIDKLFCYGEQSLYIAEKAKQNGISTYFTDDKDNLADLIKQYIQPNDVLLFKASRGMRLEEVIDKLYK